MQKRQLIGASRIGDQRVGQRMAVLDLEIKRRPTCGNRPNDDVFEFSASRLHYVEDHAFDPQRAERIDKLEARISIAA